MAGLQKVSSSKEKKVGGGASYRHEDTSKQSFGKGLYDVSLSKIDNTGNNGGVCGYSLQSRIG